MGTLWEVLGEGGSYMIVPDLFYRVVVQSIFFYGLETWVLNAPILLDLEVLYMGFSRVIAQMRPWRGH